MTISPTRRLDRTDAQRYADLLQRYQLARDERAGDRRLNELEGAMVALEQQARAGKGDDTLPLLDGNGVDAGELPEPSGGVVAAQPAMSAQNPADVDLSSPHQRHADEQSVAMLVAAQKTGTLHEMIAELPEETRWYLLYASARYIRRERLGQERRQAERRRLGDQ